MFIDKPCIRLVARILLSNVVITISFVLNETFKRIIKRICVYRDVKTSRDTTIVNVRGRGRGRGRGAARSDGGPPSKIARTSNFVSTSGLFSEGAGDGTTKRLFRSRFSNDDSAATLRRPTISAKRIKLDPQAEQKHISEIYDLDLDDTDAAVGVSTSPEYTPVVLTQGKFGLILVRLVLSIN